MIKLIVHISTEFDALAYSINGGNQNVIIMDIQDDYIKLEIDCPLIPKIVSNHLVPTSNIWIPLEAVKYAEFLKED